jgi:very-short-patch-repair endonuclease
MLHGPKRTQRRAKQLRRQMTLPEILLWRELRKRPASLKFRHQHPAGPYILDFFCARRRLAVEVDSEAHARGDRPERDAARDDWLRSQGVRICRIPAAEVLRDLDAVLRHITVTACGDYPSTAFGGPPPPPGEDRG